MPNWLQISLAVWGAVTGTLAIFIQAMSFLRDKPKISIKTTYSVSMYEPASIAIEVFNQGNRPTTIIKACYILGEKIQISAVGEESEPIEGRLDFDLTQEPKVIPPGEVVVFRRQLTHWPVGMGDPKNSIIPFVITSHGHEVRGEAKPYFRFMIGSGWRPHGIPEEYIEKYENKRVR